MEANHIVELLTKVKCVAVVGLSNDPSKPSFRVSEYLVSHGYRVIPVNPAIAEWQGRRSFPSISAIPEVLDLVLIFRRPERAIRFVNEAVEVGVPAVWLQEGVGSPEAERIAQSQSLEIVMDKCIMKEHRRLMA